MSRGRACLAAIFFSVPLSSASNVCQIKNKTINQDSGRIDLQIGARQVALLGWRHLSPSETDHQKTRDLLILAAKSATMSECAKARSTLKALAARSENDLTHAKQLWIQLKAVQKSFSVDTLGVEYTPKMWANHERFVASELAVLYDIMEKCPDQTGDLIGNLVFVHPGPEYLFAQQNKNVSILPVEDEAANAQSLSIIREMEKFPQFPAIRQFKPKTQALLRTLDNDPAIMLDKAQVERAVTEQGANRLGKILARYLDGWMRLHQTIRLRDRKDAKTIAESKGNAVVVIGLKHIADLSRQILHYATSLRGTNRSSRPSHPRQKPISSFLCARKKAK